MKVRVLPCIPHSLVFGGFEIQTLSAIEAASQAGVDIKPLNAWSRETDYDLLHLWGLENSHHLTVTWGYRAKKRIVMTALLPYLSTRNFARYHIARLIGLRRIHLEILSMVDKLVVVNQEQAVTAERLFGYPKERIKVIPNIIEDLYLQPSEADKVDIHFGLKNYIICSGNICRRKKQLELAKAAIQENIPLLIVGHPLAGEQYYADELKKIIRESNLIKWIPGLPAHSPALLAAYRGSIGFVLISDNETQPISALEAAAMGKPLLLSDRHWARQSFYRGAILVNPDSQKQIRNGLRLIHSHPNQFRVPYLELKPCQRSNVGKAYANLYAELI